MTTTMPLTATPPRALPVDAAALIASIEAYLAEQAPKTAHPLVTKTTAQLVAEALATLEAATEQATPALAAPRRLWRIIPDWALALTPARRLHGAGRQITVQQHLELTALVIQQYGHHRGGLRSRGGRRCILGAQAVLYRLGYGDEHTAQAAGARLQNALRRRGINEPYHRWNDRSERTLDDILHLIHSAAAHEVAQ
ncbi:MULTISPECIES: DUF6197 family protein [Streptomyces]|uniref:Spd198 protein n=3 Tax=Streptomyces venezuelae TaxID=54571 RepID=F2RL23_STRVP|nr:hypothetical protein [Streptomyces venezuelae]APE21391.1 hypothetical protein vnz_10395 [Streptomyces venezuelae]QER98782.1 hypothetical protein DEJ43_10535 [Streptomyces venezuelae ATCC 10712]CCA55412.1 Spd198 protein [Streptomyces venezuelae ATCC 10712]